MGKGRGRWKGKREGEDGWGRRSDWVPLSEPERPSHSRWGPGACTLSSQSTMFTLSPGTWCVPGWCTKTQKSPDSDSGSQQASGGGLPGWGTSVATGDLPTHFQQGPRVASSTSPRGLVQYYTQ